MFSLFSNMIKGGFPGMPSFVGQDRESIDAAGPVSISNTKVSHQAKIAGTLSCDHSNLNDLSVTGASTISDTTINTADFVGFLSATKCIFNGALQITSSEARISDSKVKNILVKAQNPPVDQILVLSGDTNVEGNINFASGRGTVVLEGNAVVTGEVIGGNVEKRAGNRFSFL